jgi:hypothetical protein
MRLGEMDGDPDLVRYVPPIPVVELDLRFVCLHDQQLDIVKPERRQEDIYSSLNLIARVISFVRSV